MKRAALAAVSTVAALVMLLSFKTHSLNTVATPPAAESSAAPSASSAPTSKSVTKTFTGDAADTRYGPVQVRVTVTDGKVTDATAVDYPTADPRDQQINSYAIPALNSEAVAASSASIQMISGATYTSQGYIASLQSALDKAGL